MAMVCFSAVLSLEPTVGARRMNDEDLRPIAEAELLTRYRDGERDFRGIELPEGADLRGADLRGVVLDHSWLDGVDFSDAILNGASLRHSHLKLCSFDRADLRDADFRESSIDAATFVGALLDQTRFEGASDCGYAFKEGDRPR